MVDLQDKTFNKVHVVCKSDTEKDLWVCECECGNRLLATTMQLVSGKLRDCGCNCSEKPRKVKKKQNVIPPTLINPNEGTYQTAKVSDREAVIHGYEHYYCRKCKTIEVIYCEVGIEDAHCKPSPYAIRCEKCGGIMKEVDYCHRFNKMRRIKYGQKYFANLEEYDRGVLLMKV